MAIAEVTTMRATRTEGNVDAFTALAFPNNVTAGQLLVVAGATWHDPVVSSIVVTDTVGTSYTTLMGAEAGTSGYRSFIAYGIAAGSGANSVTVNPNGSGNYGSFSIDAFSGVDATPLDVDGGASTGTSSTPSDALTTVTADALLIGVETNSSAVSIAPGGNYTQFGEVESSANSPHNAVFRIVTTAQAYTVDWTIGGSIAWAAQTVAFKPASAIDPPVHDASSNSGVKANQQNPSYSHTAGSITNGLAIIRVTSQDTSTTHSSVTYGGQSATQIGSTIICDTFGAISLWYYKAPPSGASTVQANFTEVMNAVIISTSTYSNVNQLTPVGTSNSATDFDVTAPSEARVTVTSAAGELVTAVAIFINSTNTPTTNHTSRAAVLSSGNHSHGGSDTAGAATVNMSWSDTGSFPNAILGVSLKPATEDSSISIITGSYTLTGTSVILRLGSLTWLRYRK